MQLIFLILLSWHLLLSANVNPALSDKGGNVDPVHLYRKLLKQKRGEQLQAVSQIAGLENAEKQGQIVTLMLQQIFKVLQESRLKLVGEAYFPGDPFPEEEELRDALSSVAENTALLGDLVLRLPDLAHAQLAQAGPEWQLLVRWSVGLMNDTRLYEKRENKLLHLMAQELDIIPRDPDYVNPFTQDSQLDRLAEEVLREAEKERKKDEKKQKKKKERGPRLSGAKYEL